MNMPYVPTRTYPHRSCRLVHFLTAVIGVVIIAEIFQTGLLTIVFVAGTTVLSAAGYSALRRKKFTEIMREEAAEAAEDALGRCPRLVVHRGWLRVAVASDLFLLAQSTFVAYVLGDAAGEDIVGPLSLPYVLLAAVVIAAGTGLVWLNSKSHRCAATPALDGLFDAPSIAITTDEHPEGG